MKKYLYLAAGVYIAGQLHNPVMAAQAADSMQPAPKPAITAGAAFKDAKGGDAGTASLIQTGEGVIIKLDLANLTPGVHAFHIHEKGSCEPPKFDSAGGHLNPGGNTHGFMSEHGGEDGDMPNITVAADGTFRADILNEHVTLDPNDTSKRAQLLDADGAALIIHAGADDYKTQPSGNSGDRIACAVITK